jgi:hypothetical protein
MMTFILFAPQIEGTTKIFQESLTAGVSLQTNFYSVIDQPTVDFIRGNIPQKSIILAAPAANQVLPVFVDDYMAYYPHDLPEDFYSQDPSKISLTEKLEYLKSQKAEYVLDQSDFWAQTPYLTLIYSSGGQNKVYKVNTDLVESST